MIDTRTVLWIDDEPNLMDAELFDLENNHFKHVDFEWVGAALDWLDQNQRELSKLRGVVVDILLPSRGDPRFTSPTGVPVGVRFCEHVMARESIWQIIKPKIILYTRLPSTSPAAQEAQTFCSRHGVRFCKKTASSRVALELIQDKVLSAPEVKRRG